MEHFVGKATAKTIPVHALTKSAFKRWLEGQSKLTQNWIKGQGFKAELGSIIQVPGRDGSLARVVLGLGTGGNLWSFAGLPGRLSRGRYRFDKLDAELANDAALGWAFGCYQFDRYKSKSKRFPTLVWPEGADRAHVERTFRATALARDLVNTPAGDLGPAELAGVAKELAKEHKAACKIIKGKALLDAGYPAVHAVGRGSERAPHLVDITWGDPSHRKVTLVGKGVVFDSGGLDMKSPAGMKLMKKDMGGSAMALGLASMIMDAKLAVRLRVLIPAVENSVSGDAFHPLDVLQTRKGITVEVGNTDAEGRLILCDALAEGDSERPDLMLDFATLTGAARIALGTELPALFCNDENVAAAILEAGLATHDPLWRMPLHRPYRRHLDSKVADINNIANVMQGGAITAALFLQEFVSPKTSWVHIDTMAWNLASRAGRPAGGEVFGMRAIFATLDAKYGRSTPPPAAE
jgi:leucyl aminopeptidase